MLFIENRERPPAEKLVPKFCGTHVQLIRFRPNQPSDALQHDEEAAGPGGGDGPHP